MKLLAMIFVCSTLFIRVAVGQETPGTYEACSQVLREAEHAGQQISPRQIAAVLNSANAQCLSSAETREWLNEVLFSVLLAHPEGFLRAYRKAGSAIRKNIIAELESPVSDGIDLPKVYRGVVSVKAENGDDKQTIISALRLAGDKIGLQLH